MAMKAKKKGLRSILSPRKSYNQLSEDGEREGAPMHSFPGRTSPSMVDIDIDTGIDSGEAMPVPKPTSTSTSTSTSMAMPESPVSVMASASFPGDTAKDSNLGGGDPLRPSSNDEPFDEAFDEAFDEVFDEAHGLSRPNQQTTVEPSPTSDKSGSGDKSDKTSNNNSDNNTADNNNNNTADETRDDGFFRMDLFETAQAAAEQMVERTTSLGLGFRTPSRPATTPEASPASNEKEQPGYSQRLDVDVSGEPNPWDLLPQARTAGEPCTQDAKANADAKAKANPSADANANNHPFRACGRSVEELVETGRECVGTVGRATEKAALDLLESSSCKGKTAMDYPAAGSSEAHRRSEPLAALHPLLEKTLEELGDFVEYHRALLEERGVVVPWCGRGKRKGSRHDPTEKCDEHENENEPVLNVAIEVEMKEKA
ncbi:unnamed protein product [Pseudo-nitzschia multistriata]|uniref:Uncharacterized protein n=1 Tax=Pseudo-nitzschia multistriata TaxID=183589 RepID=A0A448ZE52_9STRA|nr:unnamed protein product [Pseudo-nitzschia multistriata]